MRPPSSVLPLSFVRRVSSVQRNSDGSRHHDVCRGAVRTVSNRVRRSRSNVDVRNISSTHSNPNSLTIVKSNNAEMNLVRLHSSHRNADWKVLKRTRSEGPSKEDIINNRCHSVWPDLLSINKRCCCTNFSREEVESGSNVEKDLVENEWPDNLLSTWNSVVLFNLNDSFTSGLAAESLIKEGLSASEIVPDESATVNTSQLKTLEHDVRKPVCLKSRDNKSSGVRANDSMSPSKLNTTDISSKSMRSVANPNIFTWKKSSMSNVNPIANLKSVERLNRHKKSSEDLSNKNISLKSINDKYIRFEDKSRCTIKSSYAENLKKPIASMSGDKSISKVMKKSDKKANAYVNRSVLVKRNDNRSPKIAKLASNHNLFFDDKSMKQSVKTSKFLQNKDISSNITKMDIIDKKSLSDENKFSVGEKAPPVPWNDWKEIIDYVTLNTSPEKSNDNCSVKMPDPGSENESDVKMTCDKSKAPSCSNNDTQSIKLNASVTESTKSSESKSIDPLLNVQSLKLNYSEQMTNSSHSTAFNDKQPLTLSSPICNQETKSRPPVDLRNVSMHDVQSKQYDSQFVKSNELKAVTMNNDLHESMKQNDVQIVKSNELKAVTMNNDLHESLKQNDMQFVKSNELKAVTMNNDLHESLKRNDVQFVKLNELKAVTINNDIHESMKPKDAESVSPNELESVNKTNDVNESMKQNDAQFVKPIELKSATMNDIHESTKQIDAQFVKPIQLKSVAMNDIHESTKRIDAQFVKPIELKSVAMNDIHESTKRIDAQFVKPIELKSVAMNDIHESTKQNEMLFVKPNELKSDATTNAVNESIKQSDSQFVKPIELKSVTINDTHKSMEQNEMLVKSNELKSSISNAFNESMKQNDVQFVKPIELKSITLNDIIHKSMKQNDVQFVKSIELKSFTMNDIHKSLKQNEALFVKPNELKSSAINAVNESVKQTDAQLIKPNELKTVTSNDVTHESTKQNNVQSVKVNELKPIATKNLTNDVMHKSVNRNDAQSVKLSELKSVTTKVVRNDVPSESLKHLQSIKSASVKNMINDAQPQSVKHDDVLPESIKPIDLKSVTLKDAVHGTLSESLRKKDVQSANLNDLNSVGPKDMLFDVQFESLEENDVKLIKPKFPQEKIDVKSVELNNLKSLTSKDVSKNISFESSKENIELINDIKSESKRLNDLKSVTVNDILHDTRPESVQNIKQSIKSQDVQPQLMEQKNIQSVISNKVNTSVVQLESMKRSDIQSVKSNVSNLKPDQTSSGDYEFVKINELSVKEKDQQTFDIYSKKRSKFSFKLFLKSVGLNKSFSDVKSISKNDQSTCKKKLTELNSPQVLNTDAVSGINDQIHRPKPYDPVCYLQSSKQGELETIKPNDELHDPQPIKQNEQRIIKLNYLKSSNLNSSNSNVLMRKQNRIKLDDLKSESQSLKSNEPYSMMPTDHTPNLLSTQQSDQQSANAQLNDAQSNTNDPNLFEERMEKEVAAFKASLRCKPSKNFNDFVKRNSFIKNLGKLNKYVNSLHIDDKILNTKVNEKGLTDNLHVQKKSVNNIHCTGCSSSEISLNRSNLQSVKLTDHMTAETFRKENDSDFKNKPISFMAGSVSLKPEQTATTMDKIGNFNMVFDNYDVNKKLNKKKLSSSPLEQDKLSECGPAEMLNDPDHWSKEVQAMSSVDQPFVDVKHKKVVGLENKRICKMGATSFHSKSSQYMFDSVKCEKNVFCLNPPKIDSKMIRKDSTDGSKDPHNNFSQDDSKDNDDDVYQVLDSFNQHYSLGRDPSTSQLSKSSLNGHSSSVSDVSGSTADGIIRWKDVSSNRFLKLLDKTKDKFDSDKAHLNSSDSLSKSRYLPIGRKKYYKIRAKSNRLKSLNDLGSIANYYRVRADSLKQTMDAEENSQAEDMPPLQSTTVDDSEIIPEDVMDPNIWKYVLLLKDHPLSLKKHNQESEDVISHDDVSKGSILDIFRSVDKTAVIIQKDFYNREKIMRKIKEEDKGKKPPQTVNAPIKASESKINVDLNTDLIESSTQDILLHKKDNMDNLFDHPSPASFEFDSEKMPISSKFDSLEDLDKLGAENFGYYEINVLDESLKASAKHVEDKKVEERLFKDGNEMVGKVRDVDYGIEDIALPNESNYLELSPRQIIQNFGSENDELKVNGFAAGGSMDSQKETENTQSEINKRSIKERYISNLKKTLSFQEKYLYLLKQYVETLNRNNNLNDDPLASKDEPVVSLNPDKADTAGILQFEDEFMNLFQKYLKTLKKTKEAPESSSVPKKEFLHSFLHVKLNEKDLKNREEQIEKYVKLLNRDKNRETIQTDKMSMSNSEATSVDAGEKLKLKGNLIPENKEPFVKLSETRTNNLSLKSDQDKSTVDKKSNVSDLKVKNSGEDVQSRLEFQPSKANDSNMTDKVIDNKVTDVSSKIFVEEVKKLEDKISKLSENYKMSMLLQKFINFVKDENNRNEIPSASLENEAAEYSEVKPKLDKNTKAFKCVCLDDERLYESADKSSEHLGYDHPKSLQEEERLIVEEMDRSDEHFIFPVLKENKEVKDDIVNADRRNPYINLKANEFIEKMNVEPVQGIWKSEVKGKHLKSTSEPKMKYDKVSSLEETENMDPSYLNWPELIWHHDINSNYDVVNFESRGGVKQKSEIVNLKSKEHEKQTNRIKVHEHEDESLNKNDILFDLQGVGDVKSFAKTSEQRSHQSSSMVIDSVGDKLNERVEDEAELYYSEIPKAENLPSVQYYEHIFTYTADNFDKRTVNKEMNNVNFGVKYPYEFNVESSLKEDNDVVAKSDFLPSEFNVDLKSYNTNMVNVKNNSFIQRLDETGNLYCLNELSYSAKSAICKGNILIKLVEDGSDSMKIASFDVTLKDNPKNVISMNYNEIDNLELVTSSKDKETPDSDKTTGFDHFMDNTIPNFLGLPLPKNSCSTSISLKTQDKKTEVSVTQNSNVTESDSDVPSMMRCFLQVSGTPAKLKQRADIIEATKSRLLEIGRSSDPTHYTGEYKPQISSSDRASYSEKFKMSPLYTDCKNKGPIPLKKGIDMNWSKDAKPKANGSNDYPIINIQLQLTGDDGKLNPVIVSNSPEIKSNDASNQSPNLSYEETIEKMRKKFISNTFKSDAMCALNRLKNLKNPEEIRRASLSETEKNNEEKKGKTHPNENAPKSYDYDPNSSLSEKDLKLLENYFYAKNNPNSSKNLDKPLKKSSKYSLGKSKLSGVKKNKLDNSGQIIDSTSKFKDIIEKYAQQNFDELSQYNISVMSPSEFESASKHSSKNKVTKIFDVSDETIKSFSLLNFNNTAKDFKKIVKGVINIDLFANPLMKDKYSVVPSVSRILNDTMSDSSKQALDKWKLQMLKKLGEEKFQQFYQEQLDRGKDFHECIKGRLMGKTDLTEKCKDNHCLKSISWVLKDLTDILAVESFVVHPALGYKGIFDCVAKYKGKTVLIEWKHSSKIKGKVSSTFDAPLQMTAYMGALAEDKNYNIQVEGGLVVVAHADGSAAELFEIDQEKCQNYWAQWLQRLSQFALTNQKKSP